MSGASGMPPGFFSKEEGETVEAAAAAVERGETGVRNGGGRGFLMMGPGMG